jgi:hypothetical protein
MFPTIDLSMLNIPNSFVVCVFRSGIYDIGVLDSIPKFIYNNSFDLHTNPKKGKYCKKISHGGIIVDLPFSLN